MDHLGRQRDVEHRRRAHRIPDAALGRRHGRRGATEDRLDGRRFQMIVDGGVGGGREDHVHLVRRGFGVAQASVDRGSQPAAVPRGPDQLPGVVGGGGAGHLCQRDRAPGQGVVAPLQDQRRRSLRRDGPPPGAVRRRPAPGFGGRLVPAQNPQGGLDGFAQLVRADRDHRLHAGMRQQHLRLVEDRRGAGAGRQDLDRPLQAEMDARQAGRGVEDGLLEEPRLHPRWAVLDQVVVDLLGGRARPVRGAVDDADGAVRLPLAGEEAGLFQRQMHGRDRELRHQRRPREPAGLQQAPQIRPHRFRARKVAGIARARGEARVAGVQAAPEGLRAEAEHADGAGAGYRDAPREVRCHFASSWRMGSSVVPASRIQDRAASSSLPILSIARDRER